MQDTILRALMFCRYWDLVYRHMEPYPMSDVQYLPEGLMCMISSRLQFGWRKNSEQFFPMYGVDNRRDYWNLLEN